VLPPESFTPGLFGFAALSILLLFLVFHFIYAILKSKQLKPAPMMFFLLVLSFIAMIVSAQSSFDRITEKQTLKMAQEYQAMQEEEAAE
jgi:O-antigen ligase